MPRAAEKTPMVPMNSLTEMPLSTWTFLNTASAISVCCAGPAWPLTKATPSSHTIPVPVTATIVRLDPNLMSVFQDNHKVHEGREGYDQRNFVIFVIFAFSWFSVMHSAPHYLRRRRRTHRRHPPLPPSCRPGCR